MLPFVKTSELRGPDENVGDVPPAPTLTSVTVTFDGDRPELVSPHPATIRAAASNEVKVMGLVVTFIS